MLGWTLLEKTAGSGVRLFRGALQGENLFLPLLQQDTGLRRDRTTQCGRSLVIPRAQVRMRMGKAPLSGHTLDGDAGHCLKVRGGLSHS